MWEQTARTEDPMGHKKEWSQHAALLTGIGADKIMENNEAEKKRERKIMDHEVGLRELSDVLKCNNIHFMGVPEDAKREKGACLFEQITAENCLSLGKKMVIKCRRHEELPSK